MEMKHNTTIYRVKYDSKNYPYIETSTFYERVRESIPEICGPRGVCYQFWVGQDEISGHWNIYTYRNNLGNWFSIYLSCDTEDECKDEFCRVFEHYYTDSDISNDDHCTKRDAISSIAERMEIKYEVAESLLHWMDVAVNIRSAQIKERACQRYVRALKNCKKSGVTTSKDLTKAREDLHWLSYGMFASVWGNYKDRRLNLKPITINEILEYIEKEVLNGRI